MSNYLYSSVTYKNIKSELEDGLTHATFSYNYYVDTNAIYGGWLRFEDLNELCEKVGRERGFRLNWSLSWSESFERVCISFLVE